VAPALALVHEPAAIRLFQALKFTELGGLPNALRVLRPRSLLARLDIDALGLDGMPAWQRSAARTVTAAAPVLAPLLGIANEIWATVASGWLGAFTITVDAAPDRDGIDRLWRDTRDAIDAGPSRGSVALSKRYTAAEGYVFVHVRARDRLIGVGVVKRSRADGDPRLRGVRVATLSDLLYAPNRPRSGLAVLAGAERAARGLDADALLCSVSDARFAPLTRRRGYVPLPSNLHVLARFPAGDVTPPARIDEWWFTRGDSGGDGVF
jgi:hypothetical protein